jgi:formylmethanofuran dehydrogenase subunit C
MSTQITYVPGNVQLTGNAQGNGILIVDGDLDIHGGLNFYGLILVKGDIKFTGGGSNAVNVYGAVLAGQESYVDNTLGGSASIHFDSCALKHNLIATPPRMMAFRELTF